MYQIGTCNSPDCPTTKCIKVPECASSCTVELSSSSLSVGLNKTVVLTAVPVPVHANVSQVTFSVIENPQNVSVSPSNDSSSPYSTVVRGDNLGESTIRANVTLLPEGSCSNTVKITSQSIAWFQTQGGDVYTGDFLSDEIPENADNRNFSLRSDEENDDGFPGMIIHQSGVNLGDYGFSSDDSPDNWVAKSKYEGKPYGSFKFFKKKFALQMQEPNFVSGSGVPGSDGVYYANGPVTIGNWNLGTDRWIVLLVENGSVTVNNNIVVPPGSFLAIATTGDVNFTEDVKKAQGMFVADGNINTANSTNEFIGEGVFVSDNFSLDRDFGDERNDSTPAEFFKARPDFIMSSYNSLDQNLWWFFQQWQEIAP
jgi:hypothetical protein